MVKVASKGYTLEIVSWENDADNYRTKYLTIEDEDLARSVYKMGTTLFKSRNRSNIAIGNTYDGEEDSMNQRIVTYMRSDKILCPSESVSDMELITKVENYIHNMLGYSEDYHCRVCESIQVTYIEEDVYAKKIDFNE
jgi:hypothetical protein